MDRSPAILRQQTMRDPFAYSSNGIPLKSLAPLVAYILAAISGAIAVLGWAPFGWWPLALASYAVLFGLICNAGKPLHAGIIGLGFGIGLHLTGHGWIYAALHSKAALGIVPAGLGTLVFLIYLAAFTAVPCWLFRFALKERAARTTATLSSSLISTVLFAGLLTLGEWGRSLFFNGFTSLSLGYSLIDTWFAGYAPVAGLYGVSWAGMCTAALTSLLVVARSRLAHTAAVSGFLVLAFGGWLLGTVQWTHATGSQLSYRLIQSNVAQEKKFDAIHVRQHVLNLLAAIEQAPADIIATPETAFPLFLNELPAEALQRLQHFAQQTGSHIFAGIAITAANAEGYNSVLEIAPQPITGGMARYNKVRLMPFGEYSPAGFGWFTRSLSIPLKDMKAGAPGQRPLTVTVRGQQQGIGTLICHEDLVGRDAADRGVATSLFLNPSNLAWFEDSLAIAQRLQIVRMRALETGRPILRVANTGITAQIDTRGGVIAQLSPAQGGVLSGNVQPVSGTTPFMLVSDMPVIALSVMTTLFAFGGRRRRPHATTGDAGSR